MQKTRIHTKIGRDQKITVELNQDFDLLEILSLKLTQKDVYASLCSDYGVVCGRISINNGFGIPNAKISIFIPLSDDDENDPVISALYPYKSVTDTNDEGFRYNLLPAMQQHGGHEPTGTFPDQLDILTREEVLEVYERYYKYTVKTNNSGDFMIWGVPTGEHVIHVDVDFSDMGCFSLRPDDFIRKGYGVDDFKSNYEFKSSSDIDSLPQVRTFNKTIEVYPFWGDENICEIGITRTDFDLSDTGFVIQPRAIIIGGTFADSGKNTVNKNCVPSKNSGSKCTLTTERGKIESIRFTSKYNSDNKPILEKFSINEDISDEGSFAFGVPMNMDYVYTNEFGENEYTNDEKRGIPTAACYRFRFSLNSSDSGSVIKKGYYLAPNIREFSDDVDKSYAWSTDLSDYPENSLNLILNEEDGFFYPQDYFYRFQYNKVYTVSSFQNTLYKTNWLGAERLLGIKDIIPAEEKDCTDNILTPPSNFATKDTTNTFFNRMGIFFEYLMFTIILFLSEIVVGLLFALQWPLRVLIGKIPIIGTPFKFIGETLLWAAYQIQSLTTLVLPIITYDECVPCTSDGAALNVENSNEKCKIGELRFDVYTSNDKVIFNIIDLNETDSVIFSGFPARDCPSITGCCDSYKMSDNPDYTLMNDLTTADTVPMPRFRLAIGTNNSTFNNVGLLYVSGDITKGYEIINLPSGGYGFSFTEDQILSIFGIVNGIEYFSNTFVTTNENPLWGYVTDANYLILNSETSTTPSTESGCAMYDTLYNDDIAQSYLWFSGNTEYGDPWVPINENSQPISLPGIIESPAVTMSDGWSKGATVWYTDLQSRLPRVYTFDTLGSGKFNRKTKTGYSEFRDGVFTIIPAPGLSIRNQKALNEWYNRREIGLSFCGGIVNHSFIDNWLSGVLYFFQFKGKVKNSGKVKACDTLVRYVSEQNKFYYRSTPYDPARTDKWGMSNDEIQGGNLTSAINFILHPTTFVDLGPRDEFIQEICIDPSLDPNSAVARSIGPTSFKSPSQLIAFAINYRMAITQGKVDATEFFNNYGFSSFGNTKVLDGDIIQLISINNEAGIEGFDLDNQKYLPYTLDTLDPHLYPNVFKDIFGEYGPTPVTLRYEDDGVRIRTSLNAPGYLTESSQEVPFYLWNKSGTGFGDTKRWQSWDYKPIYTDHLQGMTYGYAFTGVTNDPYLLSPISYNFTGQTIIGPDSGLPEEFDEVVMSDLGTDDYIKSFYDGQHHGYMLLIVTGTGDTINPDRGNLYIRLGSYGQWSPKIIWDSTSDYSIYPTKDPYIGFKQILSTPFLFYFGLRPGKTGVDLFIDKFGPKGAFEFNDILSVSCEPTPTPTPTPTVTPICQGPVLTDVISIGTGVFEYVIQPSTSCAGIDVEYSRDQISWTASHLPDPCWSNREFAITGFIPGTWHFRVTEYCGNIIRTSNIITKTF